MNIDVNNNNIILRNNYIDNIPNNHNDHIINKLNFNINSNFIQMNKILIYTRTKLLKMKIITIIL